MLVCGVCIYIFWNPFYIVEQTQGQKRVFAVIMHASCAAYKATWVPIASQVEKGSGQTKLVDAVSVWRTTSRMEKGGYKDGQPTFNCLLLQFGVVAQGVQELADLMHEVENQPASTILQVCCFDKCKSSDVLHEHLTCSLSDGVYMASSSEALSCCALACKILFPF